MRRDYSERRKLRNRRVPQQLYYRAFDEDKITLVPFSDEHYGHRDCEVDVWKRNVDWCLSTRSYVFHLGDLCETATRDSVGAGIFEQIKVVQEQMEEVIEVYRPIADAGLFLGMVRGNHEFRLYKHSGFDLTRTMADRLGVQYWGDSVKMLLKVGNQNYTLYGAHPYSGARLPHTKIKVALDMERVCEAEIYVAAHTHQLLHHTRQYFAISIRDKIVVEKHKHFILSGSYLKYGSYAQQKGMEPMGIGTPKIKLHNKIHMIRVSE